VTLAVNHDGDSDSTGAITGSVLGALHGDQAIPSRWLDLLELRDVVTMMADDLAAVHGWPSDSASRRRYGDD
jgi:ADP-ribosylglycohydrolase